MDRQKPILACFITTRQPTTIWPYYGQTLAILKAQSDIQVVLCGAAEDFDKLTKLKHDHQLDCPIMAGRLSLLSLVCFLKKCRACLTTDSGSRHLANAAGIPVYYFRNLRSGKIETGNYCTTETDFAPDAEYVPPYKQMPYMEMTKPEDVAEMLSIYFESES